MTWRFIDSDLSEPAFTVAADEAMALARSKGLVPNTLHLYRRNQPTVSIGYFDKVNKSIDLDFCRENGIQIVRRVTGGSAIYTDQGHLIYGLTVDEASVPSGREKSMKYLCSAIIIALGELGIEACFKPVNDVLVGGRKISGSAQMRRRGVLLQHGTLILENRMDMMQGALKMDIQKVRSRGLESANYVISLKEALGIMPEIDTVKAAILHGFEEILEIRFERQNFSEFEKNLINELIEKKYGLNEWNLRF